MLCCTRLLLACVAVVVPQVAAAAATATAAAAKKETVDKIAATAGHDVKVKRLHTEYEAEVDRLGDSLDMERWRQEEALVAKLKEGKAKHAKLLAANQAKEAAALHLQRKSLRSVAGDQHQLEVLCEQQFQIIAQVNTVSAVCR